MRRTEKSTKRSTKQKSITTKRGRLRTNTKRLTPKVQVYAKSTNRVIPIRTDEKGRLFTVPVYKKRRRMPRSQIFGVYQNKTVPIKVDKEGRVEIDTKVDVHVDGIRFYEKRSTAVTTDRFVPLPLEDVSHAIQYVYLVRNMGNADAQVYVQLGTDHETLANDLEGVQTIQAGETTIITPLRFSKYIRLLHKSLVAGQKTKLFVVFQVQIIR